MFFFILLRDRIISAAALTNPGPCAILKLFVLTPKGAGASEGKGDEILYRKEQIMETRVALIGIMVENAESVEKLNDLLHQYRSYIIGRMGVPYREKGLSIISVVLDAPMDKISSLSGKLGMLDGVSTKTIYSRRN